MAITGNSERPRATRLGASSAATRARLIAVAERLFAERGVQAVSTNEIIRAAGQRHASACQYHFGGKGGLLQAILDKHMPGVMNRAHELLDEAERAGAIDLAGVVRAFVRSFAEKLEDPDGGKDFISINAQLQGLQYFGELELGSASTLSIGRSLRMSRAFESVLAPLRLSPLILQHRFLLAFVTLFHGLADHTRLLESSPRASSDTELFVRDLEAAIAAILAAPLSDASRARVAELSN